MEIRRLDIPEVLLLRPEKFVDERGFFSETFNQAEFEKAGLDERFVQDNHVTNSKAGTVRGLHFQAPPNAQGKLVRVVRGSVFDVALDIRRGSPTFGRFVSATLSADNWYQIWVPEGFAHGYCTLEPDTEVLYKVTDFHAPESDAGVAWDDPALAINWPVEAGSAVLAEKDLKHPTLTQSPPYFRY